MFNFFKSKNKIKNKTNCFVCGSYDVKSVTKIKTDIKYQIEVKNTYIEHTCNNCCNVW